MKSAVQRTSAPAREHNRPMSPPAPIPLDTDVVWIHGAPSPRRRHDPPLQVHHLAPGHRPHPAEQGPHLRGPVHPAAPRRSSRPAPRHGRRRRHDPAPDRRRSRRGLALHADAPDAYDHDAHEPTPTSSSSPTRTATATTSPATPPSPTGRTRRSSVTTSRPCAPSSASTTGPTEVVDPRPRRPHPRGLRHPRAPAPPRSRCTTHDDRTAPHGRHRLSRPHLRRGPGRPARHPRPPRHPRRRRDVRHVLGCHVEMTRRPGRDYPLGSRYQPDEPSPFMTVAQLRAVRDAFRTVAAPPRHPPLRRRRLLRRRGPSRVRPAPGPRAARAGAAGGSACTAADRRPETGLPPGDHA